jgi:hypothetical protein
MRRRRRSTIEDLRLAVDCLPRSTRVAMLEGIRANPIIAGAYTGPGGICPMLAAHRAGGRTNAISFARAWDRFVFAGARVNRPRPATARELRVLIAQLEASLLAEDAPNSELSAAIASHRELLGRRRQRKMRPGDTDRSHELGGSPGWAWTRVVRRYDEYERALRLVADQQAAIERAGQEDGAAREPQLV